MNNDKLSSGLVYKPSNRDQYWDIFATVIAVLIPALAILHFSSLPDQIPTHFNIKGEADSFGSKNMVWIVVGLSIALFLFLGWIRNFGGSFNYPVKITPETKQFQFNNSIQLLIRLRSIIMAIMLLLIGMMAIPEKMENLNLNKLPILLIVILFYILIKYTIKSFSISNSEKAFKK